MSADSIKTKENSMLPALALGMAAFLTQFDVTAVIIAMPAIADELGLSVSGYAWVMDAYSLSFTSALPVSGVLADRYGRRRAILGGNLLFALASLGCGAAPDGPILWAARALQGIAAAFVVTGGIALIANIYQGPKERARAFALLGVMSGIAMALGPTIGGFVASWAGWRWVFFANLPACALVAWALPRLIAEAPKTETRSLDLIGVFLMTAALVAFIEGLLQARSEPVRFIVSLSASTMFAIAFAVQQRRQKQPILDPSVFARAAMFGVAILLFAVSVGYWAVLVYLPLLFVEGMGQSSNWAGVALLAATLPMLIVPPLGGRLVLRLGWRRHFSIGMAMMTVGNVIMTTALLSESDWSRALLAAGMAAIGVGAALAHPQLSGAVVALAPPDQAGKASAVTVVMRQAGFAIGIAVLGAALANEAELTSYLPLFVIAAAACIGGLVAALRLLPAATEDRSE